MRSSIEGLSSGQNTMAQTIHYEYIWPIGSLFFYLRPLHHWVTGHVAQIEQGQKVLEIGAGYPLYKLYADKVGENGLFVAVDINQNIQRRSKTMCYWIDNFMKKNPSKHDEVVHVVGDASLLSFSDNSFDLVIASNFFSGKAKTEEVYRILKPGGRVIYAWNESFSLPAMTAEQTETCKKSGFEKVKNRPGAPGCILPGSFWNWYTEATKPMTSPHTRWAEDQLEKA